MLFFVVSGIGSRCPCSGHFFLSIIARGTVPDAERDLRRSAFTRRHEPSHYSGMIAPPVSHRNTYTGGLKLYCKC